MTDRHVHYCKCSFPLVIIISSTRHRTFIMVLWLCEQRTDCKRHYRWSVELFPFRKCLTEMNLEVIFFLFQLISIYLTRNAALAIRLWCGVDTTVNENRLNRRRTIRTNACTQEKIIEFLSILHYNESLDISTDWAVRTLQSMDNYLVGAESMGQSERGRESFIIPGLKRKHLLLWPHTFISCLVLFVENPKPLHYLIKDLIPIS